ncbi:MAG: ArsR family transcriptional regulator [Pyrinomonadaceae bacterium]
MRKTNLDRRFFESTRGKIVSLLRSSNKTVNELAAELDLTDNAIRAHLLSLERDRLVKQTGIAKGHRKPHFIYGLTDEAQRLFPTAYDSLLNTLIGILKQSLAPLRIQEMLREVGLKIGAENSVGDEKSIDDRLQKCVSTLEELGGAAHVIRENGSILIKSESCPFSEAVTEHPEVCQVAEAMLTEIVNASVKEECNRSGKPKCRFSVTPS